MLENMKNWTKTIFALIALALVASCSLTNKSIRSFKVGVDLSFKEVNIQPTKNAIKGLLESFFVQILQRQKIALTLVGQNPINLAPGSSMGECSLFFSTEQPRNFNEKEYLFSDIIIPTGPYPVVRSAGNIRRLADFAHKVIGIQNDDLTHINLKNYPMWDIKIYSSEIEALNDLEEGVIDVALIKYLHAISYVQDTFFPTLSMLDIRLNEQGFRFISHKNHRYPLIDILNRQWKMYPELLKKWDLSIITKN